jgi:asparagine synthase (glutamine-hydrolysing)
MIDSMCGIAGVLSLEGPPPSRDELIAMASALRHRGPDEHGLFRDDRCGLAHARLSILDLASGQQPMTDARGELVISYNGEVFDYLELRRELEARGARFRTHSDTEVVLEAYRAWGLDALDRLNGQFAFAIWDRRTRELVVARDRLGVRPLYLCGHGRRVLFASEVKAIFAADPSIPRALDPVGLGETFTFWSVVPPQSVFAGVEELRPGHARVYRADGSQIDHAYWRPRYDETFRGSIDDATRALGVALERATALRLLRADVPVGSYLSGGLDSSVVAALAARARRKRLLTFSLRFEDAEYDETAYQREMVARLASDHHEVVVSRGDIAAAFPTVIRHTERPILRTATVPLYLLAQLVHASGIKVVLTGEGADEMLAGYDLFREARIRRFWARAPGSTLRPRLLDTLYPYLARGPARARQMALAFWARDLDRPAAPEFAHLPRWRSAQALQRLFTDETRARIAERDPRGPIARLTATFPDDFARWDPLARDQYVELRTLLSGYLLAAQGDRVAMAASVEGRFPFLDRDVVALANSFPAGYKLHVLDEKHVLKRLAAALDLAPPSIVRRPKQPYRAPDALALAGAPRVADALAVRAGIFEPRALEALAAKCRAAARDGQLSNADNMALVGALSTQLLHHELVARAPSGDPRVEPRTVIECCTTT